MNRLLLGALVGAFLAGLATPLGADLLQWPAVETLTAYRTRSGGLLVVGVVFLAARRILDGQPRSALLVGVAIGYALEALVGPLGPGGASRGWTLVPVALVLLLILSRGGAGGTDAPTEEPEPNLAALPALSAALFGAGWALGLEGIARVLRRLGGGLPLDDGAFGTALALMVAMGGLSFGGFLARREGKTSRGGAHVATGLLGALALLGSTIAVRGVATPRGLRGYLDRFWLDASQFGQLPYDLLLGALVFVLPGFALGALLHGTRRRSTLASLCLGAAASLIAVPGLLAHGTGHITGHITGIDPVNGPHSMQLIPLGMVLMGAGGLVWVLRERAQLRKGSTLLALCASLAVVAAGLLTPVQQQRVLLAWSQFPKPFLEIFDTPEGQISIHPSAPGVERVALDNRDLTPDAEGGGADARRLRTSVALLSEEVLARGARVLFIGQLTPGRALVLADEGVTHVDRSGAWWRTMGWLEQRLFAGREAMMPTAGGILDPEDARAAIGSGAYDLIIAPPLTGAAPLAPHVDLPPGTVAVAWLDAGGTGASRRLPGPVLVVTDGLANLSIGLVWGASIDPVPTPGRPALMRIGPPLDGAWRLTWLFMRPDDRRRRAQSDMAARLSQANEDNDWRFIAKGLALHYAAQTRSSPWGDRSKKTEIDELSLVEFTDALTVGAPDDLTREVWNGLAAVLVGKREIETIDRWLLPAAQIWPLWPELERALAHAELESLDPDAAVIRLQAIVRQFPDDFEAVRLLGKAHGQAGHPEVEAQVWQALLERQPEDRRTRRKLAMALVAAGELDRARPLLEDLLEENPEDSELLELLSPEGREQRPEGFDPSH